MPEVQKCSKCELIKEVDRYITVGNSQLPICKECYEESVSRLLDSVFPRGFNL